MKKTSDLPQAPRCHIHEKAAAFESAQNEHGLLLDLLFNAMHAPAQPLRADSCRFERCVFAHAHGTSEFLDCVFDHCDFSGADLSETHFCRCQFSHCRMSGTDLIQSTLRDVTFEDCAMDYAGFGGSRFDRCRFHSCSLKESGFSNCTHKSLQFLSCRLDRSEFASTSLSSLHFESDEISGIIVSPELLRGLSVRADQALELSRLLGLHIV